MLELDRQNSADGRPNAAALHPFAARGLLVIVAVKVLVHTLHHPAYGYFRDELYYLACADRLAWGFVDHPPLSVAVLALTRMVLGDSLAAIRLPVVLAGAVSLVLTALLAREMGGGRFAQLLAAGALLVAPIYLALGSFFSMNTFEQVAWPLCALLLVRIIRTGWANGWLWFGAVAGLGLLNKHSMLLFGFALVVALFFTPERRQFLRPQLYIGGVIALVIFLPHLIWQASNGFPTLEFMRNAQAGKMIAHSVPAFLGGQVMLLHPINLLVWPVGLACLLAAPWLRPYRVLGIAFLIVLAVNLIQVAKTYYPNPAYPMLFAAAGIAYERWLSADRLRPLRAAIPVVIAAGGAVVAPLALPVLSPERLYAYTRAIGISGPREEHSHAELEIDQHIADRLGWPALVEAVEASVGALSDEERARAVVFTANYGQAGALEQLGGSVAMPPVISGHNNYWLWGPGPFAPSVMLAVGVPAADLEPFFEDVAFAATVETPFAMERRITVYICRGPIGSIFDLWPLLKRYG